MVLKELIFHHLYFGSGEETLKEPPFYQFLLWEGVMVLKELICQFLCWEGVVVLKEPIFNSFYFGRVSWS